MVVYCDAMLKRGVRAATFLLVSSLGPPARAVDPFEIQVYDGTAQNPDAFAVELHTNGVVRGSPENQSPGLLPLGHQAHFTLEPQYGVFSWWEVGGYFETAIADGSFEYGGIKFRSKWVTPPHWHRYLRLGLNMEVSLLPRDFDVNVWGMELRPIIAFENKWCMLAVNPIIDVSGRPPFGQPTPKDPTFEPAIMAVYKWDARVSLGLEYYASFGPLSGFVPVAQQEHYLYEVVNVLAIKNVEVNIGFGEGLTSASNRFVAKMILGYAWEHVTHRAN